MRSFYNKSFYVIYAQMCKSEVARVYVILVMSDISDLNECETPSSCSQICTDTKGSYKCECDEMYELMPDRRTCKASSK